MLKKLNRFILLIILFINTSVFAIRPFFRISIGFVQPSGDQKDSWDPGYIIGLNIFFPIGSNFLLGNRIAYTYMSVNEKELQSYYSVSENASISGNLEILEIMPYVRVYPYLTKEQIITFFIQCGIGYFYLHSEFSVQENTVDVSDKSSEHKPGIMAGAGILIGKSDGIQIEFFPQYHIIFTKDKTTRFFTFGFGLLF